MMKFDAGIGGTFSGAPGEYSRPAETSHDSGLIPDGCLSIVSHTSRQEDFCCGTAESVRLAAPVGLVGPSSLLAQRAVLLRSSCPYFTCLAPVWQVPCG